MSRAGICRNCVVAWIALGLVSAAWAGPPSAQPAPNERLIYVEGQTMGSVLYHVTVAPGPRTLDQAAVSSLVGASIESVNQSMSTYRDDSELSRFNASRSTDWDSGRKAA